MPVNGKSLPEFSDPPLHEVAITVQFEPLDKLIVPEIGLLWQHYGSRFSHVEQHPTVDPVIERFGIRSRSSSAPSVRWMDVLPLPRIWFLNDAKSELLQIQQDRFSRNWRKMSDADHYPRYDDHIRPKFIEDLNDFCAFLESNNIGNIVPNQCEITYVNHIRACDVWREHSEMDKVFTCWSGDYVPPEHCGIEDSRFQLRHLIKTDDGEPVGRLHVSANPAYRGVDDENIFTLNMTARGRPLSENVQGIMAFIDLGRECIVRSFADMTRPGMHERWGRKN